MTKSQTSPTDTWKALASETSLTWYTDIYVPQPELLKYTTVAITHAGMNSMGDLLYNNVPFVSIPLGADQFYLVNRAQELGAPLLPDHNTLTPELLKDAVAKVTTAPSYAENIRKISQSFKEAGGYDRAVKEIQQTLLGSRRSTGNPIRSYRSYKVLDVVSFFSISV